MMMTDSRIKKINDLFNLRKIPEILQALDIPAKEEDILSKNLINLQSRIYDLDQVLESNWDVSHEALSKAWDKIYLQFDELGIIKSDFERYALQIKKYQAHELQIRNARLPDRFSMEYYYFYKSCDVKLIRRIIMDKYPLLKKTFVLPDWRYFDLITEILDDVEDVFEDVSSINGNRFLLELYKYGIDETIASYKDFIGLVLKKSSSRLLDESKNSFQNNIHHWTLEMVDRLEEIISFNKIDYLSLQSSEILVFTELAKVKRA